MPRIPVIQHQKIAPGPPRATAVETPMIFPVPRVAARVVERAEKGERFRLLFCAAADCPEEAVSSAEDRERRIARKRFLWGKCSLHVK